MITLLMVVIQKVRTVSDTHRPIGDVLVSVSKKNKKKKRTKTTKTSKPTLELFGLKKTLPTGWI